MKCKPFGGCFYPKHLNNTMSVCTFLASVVPVLSPCVGFVSVVGLGNKPILDCDMRLDIVLDNVIS